MGAPREELPEVERAQAQLVDWGQLKDYAGFIKRAVLRHKVLVINTFMVTALMGALAAKFLPRSYYSQATLLPKRSSTIAALVNPDRLHTLDPDPPNPMRPPGEVDSVTLSAARAVLRRENLVALVKRVNLLDRWEATRAPLLRVKDAVMRTLSGRPTEDVKLDAMVGVLEKQLSVNTDDGRVTIGILWPDPQLAFELVEAAQLGFLEATEREQMATIQDALDILSEREKVASENVMTSFRHFEKVFSDIMVERRRAVGDPRVGGFNTDQQMAELRFLIRAKRRAIADAQEQHNRRLEQMQAQLVEKRKLYGPDHPERLELEQRVTALRAQESPQTRVLLQEEKEMLDEYSSMGGKGVPFPDEPMPDPYGLERVLMGILPAVSENPKAAVALDELRVRLLLHQQLRRRIESAEMERDIAQASFKYRYTVLTPADFPRKPVKPNAKVILIGGVVAGLVLAIFAAVARDVLSGRVLEAWQVKRGLGLPVLAELEEP